MQIQLKRVYASPASGDGFRVLVDRLWPRGLTTEAAAIDLWAKHVAPSTELRKRWHSDPEWHAGHGFAEFQRDYEAELAQEPAASALSKLVNELSEHQAVTLVFSAKHETRNHAVILRTVLERHLGA